MSSAFPPPVRSRRSASASPSAPAFSPRLQNAILALLLLAWVADPQGSAPTAYDALHKTSRTDAK